MPYAGDLSPSSRVVDYPRSSRSARPCFSRVSANQTEQCLLKVRQSQIESGRTCRHDGITPQTGCIPEPLAGCPGKLTYPAHRNRETEGKKDLFKMRREVKPTHLIPQCLFVFYFPLPQALSSCPGNRGMKEEANELIAFPPTNILLIGQNPHRQPE